MPAWCCLPLARRIDGSGAGVSRHWWGPLGTGGRPPTSALLRREVTDERTGRRELVTSISSDLCPFASSSWWPEASEWCHTLCAIISE